MKSRARVLGHPIHQILVMFPIGMLGWSVVSDLVGRMGRKRAWAAGARRALGGGIVGAAVAAPFGLVDWLAIPAGTRAKRLGAAHGLGNALALSLFTTSWLLRSRRRPSSVAATSVSLSAFGVVTATAWMGTELINRLGVGVYEPTSLDAPSSLREPNPVLEAVATRTKAVVGADVAPHPASG